MSLEARINRIEKAANAPGKCSNPNGHMNAIVTEDAASVESHCCAECGAEILLIVVHLSEGEVAV